MGKVPSFISPYVFPGIRVTDLDRKKYPFLFKKNERLSDDELLDIISSSVGVSKEAIFSKVRQANIVYCRQVYYKISKIYGKRVTQIAREMSCDHTTVIHSIQKFDTLYDVDESYRIEANKIFEKVGIDAKFIKFKI